MKTVEDAIFNSVIQQGAFAALFVWMLFTTQKKNEQREGKYQYMDRAPLSSHKFAIKVKLVH